MVQQERPELASSSFTRLLVKGENNWMTILDYHTGDAWQIDGVNADYRRQNRDMLHRCLQHRAQSSITAAMTADTPLLQMGLLLAGRA